MLKNVFKYVLNLGFFNMNKQIIKRPFRVSIEGNVGSGKSTLIKYFENFKEVEANPVILQFYNIFLNIFIKCNRFMLHS